MAVEGAHDSNIYIDGGIVTFQLLAPNYSAVNNKTFTFTSSLTADTHDEDPSKRYETYQNVFVYEETIGNVQNQYWFEKINDTSDSAHGYWVMHNITYNSSTQFIDLGQLTIVSNQSHINNPYEIDFSTVPPFGAFSGASITALTRAIRKLNSIQNISFNQDVQETPALVVGQEISPTQIDGPTQTTVSVDKILNNNDFIRTLVGKSDVSGQFEYGDNFLSFNKTCLNNFSVSATINELPQASFDFTIYGSLSGTSNSLSSTAVSDNAIEEINPEGLLVTFDKQSTNAVQSFNYSEIINKQATYGIGSNEPSDIQTVGPIIQEASIAIEVEDYEPEETFSFLSGSKDRNRTIKMEISGENSILNTFQLENGHLVSENVGVGVGGTIVANLKYRGYKKV